MTSNTKGGPLQESSSEGMKRQNAEDWTVLVVEDQAETAGLVVEILEQHERVRALKPCETLDDARSGVQRESPDLILLDLNLGDQSALPFIREIRHDLSTESMVVVFTVDHRPETVFQALKNGANGYLFKPMDPDELDVALEMARNGESPMSPQVASMVIRYFNAEGESLERIEQLSPRENEILALLSTGMSYVQIGDQCQISISTVRTHLNRIYRKLHVNSRGEASSLYLRSQ